MMTVTACLLFLLYGLTEYFKGQKGVGCFVFFFFLSNGFHFLSLDWCPAKYADFALAYLAVVATFHLLNGNFSFFKPTTTIYRVALFVGLYISIEFVRTIVFDEEVFSLALANYRTYLPFFSFFLVQELRFVDVTRLFKQIAVITVASTILYDLQPLLHVRFLQHDIVDEYVSGHYERFRNIPFLAYFFLLLFTIKLKLSDFKSIVLLMLFLVAILLSQHRAVMVGYATCVVIYLIMARNGWRVVQYGVIGAVFVLFASDMIISRFEAKDSKASTTDDVTTVMHLDYNRAIRDEYTNDGGTLSFRVLLLMERVNYMVQHPRYLIFGIGTRHEDSPYTKKQFRFNLGTHRQRTDTIGQISSTDIAWVDPLLRFGVIGMGLLLCFSSLIVVSLYRNRKQSDVAMGALLFYLLLIFLSFKNAHLYGNIQLFFVYLLLEYIHRTKRLMRKYESIYTLTAKRN